MSAARTAWGAAWLESLVLANTFDGSTLSRARAAAARGVVTDVEIAPATVSASVRGRSTLERRVRLGFRRLPEIAFVTLAGSVSGSGRWAASILDGDLPTTLVDELDGQGMRLVPPGVDVSIDCSCGNLAESCAHAAAVCCHLASLIDLDPLLLVTLRGGDRAGLVAGLTGSHSAGAASGAAGRGRKSAVVSRPADPTVSAAAAWRRRLGELPDLDGRRRAVGRPRVGALAPSAEFGFDQAGLDGLVRDAAVRAAAALDAAAAGDPTAGAALALDLDASIDAVRRVAVGTLDADAAASVVGCDPALTAALVDAWRASGGIGVQALLRPRRLTAAEVAAVEQAVGSPVRGRSTGALLSDGRQVRRCDDGTWVVVIADAALGWRVAGVAPSLDQLPLD